MPSVGISYIAIVPLRFKQGRCLRGTQLVTLPVDLENPSWGSSWRERRHKRDEDRRDECEEHSGPGEGSSKTY